MLSMLRRHLEGYECGHRDDDSRDTPQPSAKPEGEKYDDRIQFEALPDQQRLYDLAFQSRNCQVGNGDGENLPDTLERDKRHDRQYEEG